MIRRVIARRSRSTRRVAFAWQLEGLESRRLLAVDAGSAVATLLAGSSALVEVKAGLFARPVSTESVLAAAAAGGATVQLAPAGDLTPAISAPFTPAQIRRAYGVDQLSYDGAGQTIAIIDAYHNPTAVADLTRFSSTFGLPAPNIEVAYTRGSTSVATAPAYNSGWALEIALDVQWAHAIAPNAKILLVEAASANSTDLFGAVDYAVSRGANQVSMSFGGSEFNGVSSFDTHFNKPNVAFFAAAGDNGAEVEFPAVSPYVVGVGGTTITLDGAGNKVGETTWAGSGGATSAYVARPSYQAGFQASTRRGVPDVAYNADPNSGVYVNVNGSYFAVGGTSAGAPQWAGLAALVNQGRAANGLSTIGTGTTYGLNNVLYALAGGSSYTNPNGDFLDITAGSNGIAATTGYDNATGLGSPVANKLIPDLIAYGTSTTAAAPRFGDAGFEAVAVGTGPGAYRYNPAGSAWTFSQASGLSGNGSAFTSGGPAAPEGSQVAFIQNLGAISQAVAGWEAGSYRIGFSAVQRANLASAETVQVLVDGVSVGVFTPGQAYDTYSSVAFTVAAGTHTVTFRGGRPGGGDNTAFLDALTITRDTGTGTTAAPTVGDAGFETVAVGSGFKYNPTGSAWSFVGGAGVAGNGSGFTSGNPAAPQGGQVAFLQGQGSFSQAVSGWAGGSYRIDFRAALRANLASAESIQVLVDGVAVGTVRPSGTSYGSYSTSTFVVDAGGHTITFQGVSPTGTDYSAFVDAITVVPDSRPAAPTVGDAGFETVAVGSGFKYNPTGSAWSFVGGAGVAGNGSGFTSGNPAAPEGSQVAFLQNGGSITQAIAGWAAGNYTISLRAAQRANLASTQSFQIRVDNIVVATYTPRGMAYEGFTTTAFALAAGTHTVSIVAQATTGDNTAFLDGIAIARA